MTVIEPLMTWWFQRPLFQVFLVQNECLESKSSRLKLTLEGSRLEYKVGKGH